MPHKTYFNRFADSDLAPQMAAIYLQAPPATRIRILKRLLQPLGTLAMVVVAAGAFARFLPHRSQDARPITADMLQDIALEHVEDLARYVGQKSPEVLASLVSSLPSPNLPASAVRVERPLVNH
jgi:hypothetical protein